MRRPRANTSLRCHAEDPRGKNYVKTTQDVSWTASFGSQCVQNAFYTDTEPSNSSKLPKMSVWDQSDDLELPQYQFCGQPNFWNFNQNRLWTPRGQFLADFGARGLCLRRRYCIRQFSRVTDTQESIKSIWLDLMDSETSREHISELSRGGLCRRKYARRGP